METLAHDMPSLFQQLGLPAQTADIEAFVAAHRPLPPEVLLAEASFWTPVQARFLREGTAADADWAEVVDRLDSLLR